MGEESFVFWGDFPKFLARLMLSFLSILACCSAVFILGDLHYPESDYHSCYRLVGEVIGQVVDESGQIVEGATVQFDNSIVGNPQLETVTNQSGDFGFWFRGVVECSGYEIRVRARGYQPYEAEFSRNNASKSNRLEALFGGDLRIILVREYKEPL